MTDIPLEAAYLRAALLVGLAHERDVAAWADARIVSAPEWSARLADIALTPVELSAMREALYPIARHAAPDAVLARILDGFLREDPKPAVPDLIRRLTLLRTEFRLAPEIDSMIKTFSGRAMLVSGGVPGATMPTIEEIMGWLKTV